MKTYLFYDIETSGLNPAFDQVLTFAAIRTDLELNELERTTITIRLRKDVVPSPYAFITHRLTFKELAAGVSEYNAARAIHELVNRPGTISLGYNSLGFDDEFLRFLFYRNLLNPYSHQYSQGCSRMDILPVTVIFRLFCPMDLNWPMIDGKPSLKLEWISRDNAFATSGKAHEAMNDVEALVALSRTFFREKRVWDYSLDFFNKQKEGVRIAGIKKEYQIGGQPVLVAIMVSTSFGSDRNYMAPVLLVGGSEPYKNQTIWLRLDRDEIPGVGPDDEPFQMMVIRKRSADAYIVLPPLERFWQRLSPEVQAQVQRNLSFLDAHYGDYLAAARFHCRFKYPDIPEMDMDARLYQDGFFSRQEKADIKRFHNAGEKEKPKVLELLSSARIKGIARRILYRNMGESRLPKDVLAELQLCLDRLRQGREDERFIGFRSDWKFTCDQAGEDLARIREESSGLDPEQQELVRQVTAYLSQF